MAVTKKKRKQQVELPEDFLKKVKSVTAKRAKTVIDHILEHGYITTEELSEKYGYDHPPRAARDVREQGIPLETFRVTGTHGRKIGAYRFGDPTKIKGGKLGGWSKSTVRVVLFVLPNTNHYTFRLTIESHTKSAAIPKVT